MLNDQFNLEIHYEIDFSSTFQWFCSIHRAYQGDSHSVNIQGMVLEVKPVQLAADIYCNCAIPIAKV